MKKIDEMNIGELAAYICSSLLKNGIECVLSGGACVSIYSKNQYQSYDLDFIEKYSTNRKKIKEIMIGLGFYEENRYFKHKDTDYLVEFPTGPLSIGSEPVKEIFELKFSTGKLLILSPTECVKDRLAAYFYWDDIQSLEQALLVAKENEINFREISRWSKSEGEEEKWIEIQHKFGL